MALPSNDCDVVSDDCDAGEQLFARSVYNEMEKLQH